MLRLWPWASILLILLSTTALAGSSLQGHLCQASGDCLSGLARGEVPAGMVIDPAFNGPDILWAKEAMERACENFDDENPPPKVDEMSPGQLDAQAILCWYRDQPVRPEDGDNSETHGMLANVDCAGNLECLNKQQESIAQITGTLTEMWVEQNRSNEDQPCDHHEECTTIMCGPKPGGTQKVCLSGPKVCSCAGIGEFVKNENGHACCGEDLIVWEVFASRPTCLVLPMWNIALMWEMEPTARNVR